MDQIRFKNALALRDSGCIEDAVREFRSMATEAGDPNERASLMINEVRCYCSLGRLFDAERTLGRIRELAPDDTVVRMNVDFGAACLSSQKGEFGKALIRYEEMSHEYIQLLRTPEYRDLFEDIQRRRAFALVTLGRYAEALPVLDQATSFMTLGVDGQQEIYLYLGICYTELHEPVRAKEAYLQVIDFGLKNGIEAQARYRVAILFFTVGAFAQAKQHLEMILQNPQGNSPSLPRKYVYEQLSRACHYLGEEQSAKRYLNMARESSV